MIKNGLNPAIFAIMVVFAAAAASNFAAGLYLEKLYGHYDEKLASLDGEAEKILSETESVKAEAAFYADAVKIRDMFAELSGGRYGEAQIMRYSLAIAEESSKYNIDPALVMAIIATESSFRDRAVSHKGAIGMMQLLPSTAFYISDKLGHTALKDKEELFDPETNLRLGVAYLAYLINKTGSTEHAIIAYNYGPVNLKRALTKNRALPKKYMRTVMRNYGKITASVS